MTVGARPNVLVFMADQLPLSATLPGSGCCMPNLERLAERGCRFSHAFTPTPICTPARSSFQTGLLPHQHKLIANAHHGKHYHILGDFLPGTRLLGDELQAAGYRTAYFGKWDSGLEHPPDQHGYEHYQPCKKKRDGASDDVRLSHTVRIPGEADPTHGLISAETSCPAEHFGCSQVAAAVEHYLAEPSVNDDRPFYIFASCTEPHVPWLCPSEYAHRYDPQDIPEWQSFGDTFEGRPGNYLGEYNYHNYCHPELEWPEMAQAIAHAYGVISMVDDALGRMLEALESQGVLDNTLVLFTSDHGEHLGRHGLIGKGTNLLDELVRIPFVMSWPAQYEPQTCDAMVDLTDGFATLLDVAGSTSHSPPASRSLVPLLSGQDTDAFPDRAFFQHHGAVFLDCVRGIRTRRHKYVFRAHDTDEFYDLESDPDEMDNRVDDPAHRTTIDGLRQDLLQWMTESQDMAARGAAARFSRRSALL